MTVLLRHTPSGYYYGGPNYWVSEPEQAVDLKTVESARAAQTREHVPNTEVLVVPDTRQCDWVSMLPKWNEPEAKGRAA